MTPGPAELRPWTRRRWWLFAGLIMAGQVGAILWLGDRTPVISRPPAESPRLQLAGNASAELLALNDPTLFALPHWQGFSGPAWLNATDAPLEPVDRPEEPHWLPLPVLDLGAALNQLAQTNAFDSPARTMVAKTELMLPNPPPLATAYPESLCVLDGELAQRQFEAPIQLPSWTNADILTNSVVRLAVDAAGRTVSAALISGSGNRAADEQALANARAARFDDIRGTEPSRTSMPSADLAWGDMVFEWHTLPIVATNAMVGK
jgi:hypothetical protein